jgi:hypothetical protein
MPKTLLEVFSEEREAMEFIHEGIVITVSGDGHFTRESSELDYEGKPRLTKYNSLKEAKEDIDLQLTAARKSNQTQVNVELVDEHGRIMLLRRVHEGTGEWLTGKGQMVKPGSGYLNMDIPKELLAQREVLREQVREVDEKLRPYSLSLPKGYGKQTAERVENLVARLKKAIAEAEMRVTMLQEVTIEKVDAMLQGEG